MIPQHNTGGLDYLNGSERTKKGRGVEGGQWGVGSEGWGPEKDARTKTKNRTPTVACYK